MNEFEKLYEEYFIVSRNFTFYITNNLENAEDVLQESWFKVYRSYLNNKINKNFKSYLFSTIKNTYIDTFIKKKENQNISIEDIEIDLPGMDNVEKEVIKKIHIEEILNQFTGIEKRIIELLMMGYKYSDIADELNISIKRLYKFCYKIKFSNCLVEVNN
jgi:RNA polymerase sigma factor (sigma-70 family)